MENVDIAWDSCDRDKVLHRFCCQCMRMATLHASVMVGQAVSLVDRVLWSQAMRMASCTGQLCLKKHAFGVKKLSGLENTFCCQGTRSAQHEVTLAAQKPLALPVIDRPRLKRLPSTMHLKVLPMMQRIRWGTENLKPIVAPYEGCCVGTLCWGVEHQATVI